MSSAQPVTTSAKPPPNCSEGGVWGKAPFVGTKTQATACLCCLILGPFALLVCCCPFDEKDAYCVNHMLYDAMGTQIGPKDEKFTPYRA